MSIEHFPRMENFIKMKRHHVNKFTKMLHRIHPQIRTIPFFSSISSSRLSFVPHPDRRFLFRVRGINVDLCLNRSRSPASLRAIFYVLSRDEFPSRRTRFVKGRRGRGTSREKKDCEKLLCSLKYDLT